MFRRTALIGAILFGGPAFAGHCVELDRTLDAAEKPYKAEYDRAVAAGDEAAACAALEKRIEVAEQQQKAIAKSCFHGNDTFYEMSRRIVPALRYMYELSC